MRDLIMTLSLCLLVTGYSPVRAASLMDVFQQAVVSDPTYLAAISERDAALQAKPQARSLYLPQLSVDARYGRIRDTLNQTNFAPATGLPFTKEYNSGSYGVSLNQVIYNGDFIQRLKQAGYEVMRAEANFNAERQALLVRVAERYFNVLDAQDNLEFARSEKKAIGEQLNQTKQRFNVGLTAITDVAESQAGYDQSVAQEIAAENQLAIAREELREVTGVYYDNLARLAEDFPLLTPEPANIEEWVKTALDQNLFLIAAENAMQTAEHEVKRQRAGHLPTLNLNAGYSATDQSDEPIVGRESEDLSATLVLEVPIYEGGRVQSQTRQAAAQYQQSKDLYEAQRRATEREARSAYLTTLANISGVRAVKQALVSTQTALEATEAGFDVGTRTAVDVLNRQRDVFQAKSVYAGARYDYVLQTLILKQAAGVLTVEDLESLNKWLR
ncbi:MAG: TolC family outer membrane protein [Pseudomonadota bacterium]|nr:MAG: TolC family outer membrane protein [Pseudomonadota bacterium]